MMDLSVIIVNYNVRHFLEQCLLSVRAAARNIGCEIIVIDNNSADGSCSMVKKNFPEVKLVMNTQNRGFSAACNQGIVQSEGKYVLLLNPDTLVEEDTFAKCLEFMKDHPEAGALGVRMIDGHGRLLPESKRALPTPVTAFFKMTGISRLFPRSHFFNRYYMGHIDSLQTAQTDILSGAFMFIRKEALDVTGLLDETFFMYGEDIDLSYRLIKAGYRNYYFPEVKIIHYKGESTRKGDLNYIVHFYKAMLIFINKHFGRKKNLSLFILLYAAVLFWGFVAILGNFYRKYFLIISDIITITVGFAIIIPFWENIRYGSDYNYPREFWLIIPVYSIIVVLSVFYSGGYRSPSKITGVIKGIVLGIIINLVIYSMLPIEFRFSRAVVLLGGLFALVFIPALRLLYSLAGMSQVKNPAARQGKILIVCNEKEYQDLEELVLNAGSRAQVTGRVSIHDDDLGNEVLGNISQIMEIIRINRPDEVVISARDISASQIIDLMSMLSGKGIRIRIAPSGEKLLIGSNSVQLHDDYSKLDGSTLRFD